MLASIWYICIIYVLHRMTWYGSKVDHLLTDLSTSLHGQFIVRATHFHSEIGQSIVANRPDLPGKVPLIRPCPVSRPTERSFNGLSRWLPSRAENSCTLTLSSKLARMLSQRLSCLQRVARPLTAVLYLEMQCFSQLLLQVRVSISFGSM